MSLGKLYVVGVGPGHHDHMTFRAKKVIEESQIIVGYETYVSLVEDLIGGKEVYRYPMTQEVDRANQAIAFAEKGNGTILDIKHFLPLSEAEKMESNKEGETEDRKPVKYNESMLTVPYNYTYGFLNTRFARELRDNKRLMGIRCLSCKRVQVPPKSFLSIAMLTAKSTQVKTLKLYFLTTNIVKLLPRP